MDTRYYDLYAAWMEGFLTEYDLLVAGGVIFFLAMLGISFLLLIYEDWLFDEIGDKIFFGKSRMREKAEYPANPYWSRIITPNESMRDMLYPGEEANVRARTFPIIPTPRRRIPL